ncbi:MAG TPA: glycoside hydrolase family 30 beta sandwich domain-containing protein [Solirubrobacteraceae bacterium]
MTRHRQLVLAIASLVLAGSSPVAFARPAGAGPSTRSIGGSVAAAAVAPPRHRRPPPPPPVTGPAIAVSPASDHRTVFWRAPGGGIEEAFYTTSWHGPAASGWHSASPPSVATDDAGEQYVFWSGPHGHIYEEFHTRHWHRPQDLTAAYHWGHAGSTASTPAVAVNPVDGNQYVFWRTSTGQIEEAWFSGRWHHPVSRGWRAASAPSATVNGAGHEYVTWLGANGHIVEAAYTGRWGAPYDLTRGLHWGRSGTSASPPAIAVNPTSDEQYLFWRGSDGRIYDAWSGGAWHGPSTQGWRSDDAPSIAVNAAGDQHVVWGAAGQIWEAWYQDSWTPAVARWHASPGRGQYVEAVQTTANLAQHMSPVSDLQFGTERPGRVPVITIHDRMRYQRVTGVGAAMTDTSAWLLGEQVSPAERSALMSDLFTTRGIRLAFTLVPMGGTDFTVSGQPYSYDDLPANQTDPALQSFSVAHDQVYVLPVLRQMLAVAPHEETFAVPWSPPGWMKANDALNDLHHRGTLLPGDYGPLAGYFVRFLQDYAQQGVPISSIAPENEPRAASAFPALNFPEPSEAQWLTANLKPALAAAGLHPLVYGSNTSWGSDTYARALAATAPTSGLNGIAWHCYSGVPTVMSGVHYASPALDQLVTECAPNLSSFPVPEVVIGSMRNWASAVTLWNVALDPSNGPVQAPNTGCHGCRGLLVINEHTHQVDFNLSYYQLGQVGSFVEPGAQRINSNHFVTYAVTPGSSTGVTPGLDDLAVLNPDGSHVLVAYNNSTATIHFAVSWGGRSFSYALPPAATVTFRWNG